MTRVKGLFVVLVVLAVSAAYADVRVFQISGNVTANQRHNTQALCSFKGDLQRRVDSGVQFLKTHPHGIPGISATTIRVGIQNQESTLRALSPLVC